MSNYIEPKRYKIFKQSNSHALKIPKECLPDNIDEEFYITQVKDSIIITPVNDPHQLFFEGLETLRKNDFKFDLDKRPPQHRSCFDDL